MIKKFEGTETWGIQPEKGRKCVAAQVVGDVGRSQTTGSSSVRRIVASVDQARSMVHKILRKVLRYYCYAIANNLQL
ncbi:hypothetical protein TNCV_1714281 [Trichonephila clavipes]|nr:hypothetical protein TNCV_1714281 [Trichonephila clavipes]